MSSRFLQSLSEKLARKDKEYQELEECLGAEKAAKKGVQDSLREREQEVQELQARATGAEASLQKVQTELGERTEEAAKLKSEIAELEVKHAELKVERKQLEQQREEKESQGAQQQTEISQVSVTQTDYIYLSRTVMTFSNSVKYILRASVSTLIVTVSLGFFVAAHQTAGGREAAGRGARSSERTEAAVWGETKRPRAASSRPAAQALTY